MTAINQKLVREVWQHRGQLFSIAAVVATGIMMVLTMRGTYESLVAARDAYYRDARFPDVWVQLERAPESLARRLRVIPGVTAVDTRVTFGATIDVPTLDQPAQGLFVSVPERQRSLLGGLHLTRGRYIAPGRRDEVVVSKKFATANRLGPGDVVRAVVNGRRRDLAIVGVAITPEHTYAMAPGSIFPDDQRYGIFWINRDVAGPSYDMEGAFNEAVFALSPRADVDEVLADIDRLVAPYGGLGAYGRDRHPVHLIIDGELKQLQTMGTAIPAVFLGVAAFLLNIVLGRLIATQRTEIAVLKAFGYNTIEIGRHYLGFAMSAVVAGAVSGAAAGIVLGGAMVDLYGSYFDFPRLSYAVSWTLVAIASLVSTLAAGAGALGAVRRATALPPAEAMRPEPPATYHAGIFERLRISRAVPASGRMILRNIERQPFRTVFSALGVAFSVAILVIGMFMFDGVDYMMDLQFRVAQREDMSLTFNQPLSASAAYDLAHLQGVTRVEPFRAVPVRLRAGHLKREVAITGLAPGTRLRQIVTAGGVVEPVPPQGLMLSAILAKRLAVGPGDDVTVEVLEGSRRIERIPVAGLVEDFVGLSAYMELDALHRLTRGGRAISGAYLAVAEHERAGLSLHLKQVPAVAGVASPQQMLETFEAQLADSLFIGVFFILGFSAIIAVAVIYNGARIALSERGRELASLRVLGFTRAEVAVLLFGEQALVTLLAIPVGWLLGYALSAAVVVGLTTETYRIPLVISGRTYALAAAITLVAAVASGLIVRRRLDRLDLVAVLKTREG
ncbi:MAG: ABC transporter permease [Acidobacteria bacterium]|nr:ABC transporter permease [Acidobacteriota bacterium]